MLKRIISIFLLFIALTPTLFADQLIIEPDMGRKPILNAINDAHYSLQLVMYGFTDQTLLNALLNQYQKGRTVQVILEPTPYKTEKENAKTIRAIEQAGLNWHDSIPDIRLIHQKTLLIDKRKAMVMTFNFTQSTFKNMRNFALLIDNPNDVNEIADHFTSDWNQKSSLNQSEHLIWSPENSREKIISLIKEAKQSIEIYAQQVSDFKIIGALANTAKRGVQINILTSKKLRDKQESYLTNAGVVIRYSPKLYIHAKVFIIDNNKAIIGSTNLTRPSLDNNRELSVVTEDREIVQQLKQTFENDWRNANEEQSSYSRRIPSQRTLLRSLLRLL